MKRTIKSKSSENIEIVNQNIEIIKKRKKDEKRHGWWNQ